MGRHHRRFPIASANATAVLAIIVLLSMALAGAAARRDPQGTPSPADTGGIGPSGTAPAAHADNVPVTPCTPRCLVRIPADFPMGTVWRHGAVAYAVVDAASMADLSAGGVESTVVQPGDETLALYGMFGARPEDDALIASVGTVIDRRDDVRLVAALKTPLNVRALYSAGVHVEKVAPPCPRAGDPPAFSLATTVGEIVGVGASDRLPLGDRQYDGPGTTMAAAYLYCRFDALGFAVRYDDFMDGGGRHQLNVVAQEPNHPLGADTALITGHYDTRSPAGDSAPGADDNASGIAAMLDLASREARNGLADPLGFVAFAAEEPGLLGSAAYAAELARDGVRLRAVVNLDAIGIPNNGDLFVNGNAASRALYLQLVAASTDDQTLLWMTNPEFLSDDEELRRHGYVAAMLTTHPYGTEPLHHTDRDRIENLDFGQIAAIVDLVWRWLAASPR